MAHSCCALLLIPSTPGLSASITSVSSKALANCFQEVAIKKVLQDKRFKVCAGPVCALAEGMVGYGTCGRQSGSASLDPCGCRQRGG